MQRSEDIKDITTALSSAMLEINTVVKDHVGKIQSRKGAASSYQYKYATLDGVWNACKEALSKHDLVVVQSPSTAGNGARVCLTTLLAHKSGQWIEGQLEVPTKSIGIQDIGGAITYARRYALMSFLGIAPEDADDDGAASQSATAKNQTVPADQKAYQPAPKNEQPSSAVPATEKMRDYLKQAGCKDKEEALKVINWLSQNAFESYGQAIGNEQASGVLVAKVHALLQEGKKISDFLQLANEWQIANESFPADKEVAS